MQIEYIKDAPRGKPGDIAEVPDNQARVLIIRGYAKEHKPRRRRSKKDDTTNDTDDTE